MSLRSLIILEKLVFCELCLLISLLEVRLFSVSFGRLFIFSKSPIFYELVDLTALIFSKRPIMFCEFWPLISLLEKFAYFLWLVWACWPLISILERPLVFCDFLPLIFSRKVRLFSVNLLTAYLYSRNVRLFSVSFDRLFRFSKSPLIFCELVDRLFIFFIFCEFRPLIFSLGKSAYLYILETSAYFLWVLTAYFSSRKVRLFSVSVGRFSLLEKSVIFCELLIANFYPLFSVSFDRLFLFSNVHLFSVSFEYFWPFISLL